MEDLSKLVNEYSADGKFQELIEILLIEIEGDSNDHWLLGNLASAYYEIYDYEQAYSVIGRAMKIKKDCPLLWWHLAGILEGLGKKEEAITVWEEILKFDKVYIDFIEKPCWESEDFKNGLVVDSYYRIANALINLDQKEEAKPYFEQYIERKILHEDSTQDSIYKMNEILKQYNMEYKIDSKAE